MANKRECEKEKEHDMNKIFTWVFMCMQTLV